MGPGRAGRAGVMIAIVIPGALIAGGALAAIAGGALLDLGRRRGPDDRYRYAGAALAGARLGGVGAAALVMGIYPCWHVPAPSAPSLGIGGGAGVAGWATAL